MVKPEQLIDNKKEIQGGRFQYKDDNSKPETQKMCVAVETSAHVALWKSEVAPSKFSEGF